MACYRRQAFEVLAFVFKRPLGGNFYIVVTLGPFTNQDRAGSQRDFRALAAGFDLGLPDTDVGQAPARIRIQSAKGFFLKLVSNPGLQVDAVGLLRT